MIALTNDRYPRGMPFRPPPANRRKLLVAGAAVLLFACVAGAVWSFRRTGPPPAPPAPPAPRPANERTLEALGSLSASHLYQSYLNIGMLADAVEHETYTLSQAQEMLTTVVGLMDIVDRQLDRLAKTELGADDRRDVERIRLLSALLRVQVAALRAYWRTHEAQQAARYHEAREKSWKGLSEVLGL